MALILLAAIDREINGLVDWKRARKNLVSPLLHVLGEHNTMWVEHIYVIFAP
jgi:hypothetical protein